jgi:hypothetical protein
VIHRRRAAGGIVDLTVTPGSFGLHGVGKETGEGESPLFLPRSVDLLLGPHKFEKID